MAKYDRRVIFRASEMDYIRWRACAVRAGAESFGEWARRVLNEAGGRLPAERVEAAVERVEVAQVRTVSAGVGSGRVGALQSSPLQQERERARELAARSGKCTADVERGVRCRFCGKVH